MHSELTTIMSNYSLSSNIELGTQGCENYVVTTNAMQASQRIVQDYLDGHHSFHLIGTYGTGKSTFILQFERDLSGVGGEKLVGNAQTWAGVSGCSVINIVGQYCSLSSSLTQHLNRQLNRPSSVEQGGDDPLLLLNEYYRQVEVRNELLIIAIDEFGKILEHAAKFETESELFFVQQFAEWVNAPQRKVILLLSMHQNFSSYSPGTTEVHRSEWKKVQGRFREIQFSEPIEQLLLLATDSLKQESSTSKTQIQQLSSTIDRLYHVAQESKLATSQFTQTVAHKLFPLDACAAMILTSALQRYGQNSRSIFALLHGKGENNLRIYPSEQHYSYSLNDVYDYLTKHFASALHQDYSSALTWQALQIATERVESVDWKTRDMMLNALKIVRSIALLQLFGSAGVRMSKSLLVDYLQWSMNMVEAGRLIDELVRLRIIRFAVYRQSYVLFEGTDFNIEGEVAKAMTIVTRPTDLVSELRHSLDETLISVRAHYYRSGTPRSFLQTMVVSPQDLEPIGEIDGYLQVLFPKDKKEMLAIQKMSEHSQHANIFVACQHVDDIVLHLHHIKVYEYVLDKILIDKSDRVAIREIQRSLVYEKQQLSQCLQSLLLREKDDVTWWWQGKQQKVRSHRDVQRLLSNVCDTIYFDTPILRNELLNRHKLSSNISTARSKFLQAMLANELEEDFGWESTKFPPEKTIYYALLKNSGLHDKGGFISPKVSSELFSLWRASDDFLRGTQEKARKVSELQQLLSKAPYKVKQGVLDFWIPTFLYMRRLDFSLFGVEGNYVPELNMECFELLKKRPSDFSIKAYAENGVKIELFNQYRKFLNIEETENIVGDKFIETIKPFFFFYRNLNDYAKRTKQLEHHSTIVFREVLASAKDPERAFLEEMPSAFGFDTDALQEQAMVAQYSEYIARAVHDLRHCYIALIDRIEARLLEFLHLAQKDYASYIVELQTRLRCIKQNLISPDLLRFVQYALSVFEKRQDWYQSIAFAVLNKPLYQLQDREECDLIEQLVHRFAQCEEQLIVSRALELDNDVSQQKDVVQLSRKIEAQFSEDPMKLRAALLHLLNKLNQ